MVINTENQRRDGLLNARGLYWTVAIVAVVLHAVSMFSTQLWVYPDSIDYIELAGGLVNNGDWDNELFLIRPLGYPVFLAAIFKLFGSSSPMVIQIVQHAIGIATAVWTVALALIVTRRKSVALLAGILCSMSLQLLAYCNMPLTEIPFTFVFVGATYFLIRYWKSGRWNLLAACAVCVGTGYIIKPIGVLFFGVVAMILCVREWITVRSLAVEGSGPDSITMVVHLRMFLRRLGCASFVAGTPAMLIVLPWLIQCAQTHASNGTSRCLDYILYLRPVELGRLDLPSTRSAAIRDIREVVAEAQERDLLAPEADYHDRNTVILAYKRVRGMSFTETTKILGQAGLDVMLENPRAVVVNAVKDAAWMLLAPDPVYRFVPGGAPGIGGQRNKSAELFDISTYSTGPDSWQTTLAAHERYLPLSNSPRVLTTVWNKIKRTFRSQIDRGPSPIGLRDSLYEEFILFCFLGGVMTIVMRRNAEATILVLIVFLYVGISALLSGPQTRYAVVVKPILLIWAAVSVVACADGIFFVVRSLRRRRVGAVDVLDKAARSATPGFGPIHVP